MDLQRKDSLNELLLFMNQKAPAVRLPWDDVSLALFFEFAEHVVKLHGEIAIWTMAAGLEVALQLSHWLGRALSYERMISV